MSEVKLINETDYLMLLENGAYPIGEEPYPYCNGGSCHSILSNSSSQSVTIPKDSSSLKLNYTLCLSPNEGPDPRCNGYSPGSVSIQFQPGSPQVSIAKADPNSNFTLTASGNTYTLRLT